MYRRLPDRRPVTFSVRFLTTAKMPLIFSMQVVIIVRNLPTRAEAPAITLAVRIICATMSLPWKIPTTCLRSPRISWTEEFSLMRSKPLGFFSSFSSDAPEAFEAFSIADFRSAIFESK